MMKRMRKELARVMDEATARGETSCALALLWRNGEEKLFHASGYADLGRNVPAQRDTVFRLYSMTKPITAVTAMTLVERGDLDLCAPVGDYLPGFRDQRIALSDSKTVPVSQPMLVRDLFTMTSGLCYAGDTCPAERATAKLFAAFNQETAAGCQPDTLAVANRIGELPLAFSPGERWHYGTSADVLGAVVEVVAGMPLDEYMQEALFDPLGMRDTGFAVSQENRPRFATLYEHRDGILAPYPGNNFGLTHYDERPNFISGGAGLTATLDDVLRFARMLLGGGSLGGERVLGQRSVEWLSQDHLTRAQRDSITLPMMRGYGYGGLMRTLLNPARGFSLGVAGEFGWDGWAGAYMTVCPALDLVFLVIQHTTEMGTSMLTRKLRNMLYAGLA